MLILIVCLASTLCAAAPNPETSDGAQERLTVALQVEDAPCAIAVLGPTVEELRTLATRMVNARDAAISAAHATVEREIDEIARDHDAGTHVLKPETVDAIRICALARDADSTRLLLLVVDRSAPVYKMEGKSPAMASSMRVPVHKLDPARAGLVAIGAHAGHAIVSSVTAHAPPTPLSDGSSRVAGTLIAIAGPENAIRLLEQSIKREGEGAGDSSKRHELLGLRKRGAVIRYTEKPEYQLYEGVVFRDLSRDPEERGVRKAEAESARSSNPALPREEPPGVPIENEIVFRPEQRELRELAAEMAKAYNAAILPARAAIAREIEDAAAHPAADYQSRVMKAETLEAIRICAFARDAGSARLLVEAIDFRPPLAQVDVPGPEYDRHHLLKRRPAQSALVIVGVPAVRPLIDALADKPALGARPERLHLMRQTLAAIAGPEQAVRLLEDTMWREPNDERRERLSEALKQFQQFGEVPLLTDKPDFQLYQGNVAEDLATAQ